MSTINSVWKEYHKNKSNIKANQNIIKAIELFNGECGQSIDIGCGSGADSLFLINSGWKVIAVDIETTAITELKDSLSLEYKNNLTILKSKFEDLEFSKVNLINASFSLPFCKPKDFESFWNNINLSILKDGRFSGNLFGDRDSWAKDFKDRSFHTREQINYLFKDFEIEFFEEREYDGFCMSKNGEKIKKHWHYFNIIAKKKV